MVVELVSANFPVEYRNGKLATLVDGFERNPKGWIINGAIWTVLFFAFAPHGYNLLLSALTFAWCYSRRNSKYSKWRPIPREEIAEVKVVADESRVKVGSRFAFGILATQSRETLVSVALTDDRKALFKTDRNGLTAMLTVGH